jgi:hypothetical protein
MVQTTGIDYNEKKFYVTGPGKYLFRQRMREDRKRLRREVLL